MVIDSAISLFFLFVSDKCESLSKIIMYLNQDMKVVPYIFRDTDLSVSSVQYGLPNPAESFFTPESVKSLLLRSTSLKLEELELKRDVNSSQHLSDRLQPLSLEIH